MTSPLLFDCPPTDELEQDAAWWEIYDEAFPAGEREPRPVILGSVRGGVGLAVRARHGSQTVGLATVHLLCRPAAVFLVYLAVARSARRQGIGGSLLEYAWRAGADQLRERGLTATGLIWEVDIPALATAEDETARREQRMAFYRRHGGELLPRRYAQPPLDGIAPVPMYLMYRPTDGTSLPDAATTEALVRALYFEKYGAANGIPRQTLASLLQDDRARRRCACPPARATIDRWEDIS